MADEKGALKMHTIKLFGTVGDENFNVRLVKVMPPGPVKIVVDSMGGCLITAFAIYRQLIEHPYPVETEIVRASSAATLVSMAGDRRLIHGSGYFFVHRSWGSVIGTANTLRKALEQFDEWDAAIAAVYAERAGLSLERVFQVMDGEITLSPAEALKLGFVDQVLGEPQEDVHSTTLEKTALACIQLEEYASTPAATALRNEAHPVALQDPHAGPVLDALYENVRREQSIQQLLVGRLRRAIDFGHSMTWPARATWTCSNCSETNYGPPSRDKLPTPCCACGTTTTKEPS